MSNPKFTDKNGNNSYVWEEWPDLPSDRVDISSRIHAETMVLEHFRNKIISAREVLATRGIWILQWKNISRAMVTSLRVFNEQDYFRFYFDGDSAVYREVWIASEFNPENQRGGTFNLSIELKERSASTEGLSSSSSSESTRPAGLFATDYDANRIYEHVGLTATITNAFASQAGDPQALAHDGSDNLIEADPGSDIIYVHSGTSSTITSTFATNQFGYGAYGMTFDGTDLWTGQVLATADKFYHHSGVSGVILNSFNLPRENPAGMTWDGSNLIVAFTKAGNDAIYVQSGTTSAVTTSFAAAGDQCNALAFDEVNGNLISVSTSDGLIFVHSGVTATITDSFAATRVFCTGMTYVSGV